ncbi:hypothetical protein H8959_007284 [Pygathrix nigripes]
MKPTLLLLPWCLASRGETQSAVLGRRRWWSGPASPRERHLNRGLEAWRVRKRQLPKELSGCGKSTLKGPSWDRKDKTGLRNKRPLWLQKASKWERSTSSDCRNRGYQVAASETSQRAEVRASLWKGHSSGSSPFADQALVANRIQDKQESSTFERSARISEEPPPTTSPLEHTETKALNPPSGPQPCPHTQNNSTPDPTQLEQEGKVIGDKGRERLLWWRMKRRT